MEIGELETLESKTLTILSTLESLESEVTQYQQKSKSIVTAFETLKEASGSVAAAGRVLSDAADVFRRSDLAGALKTVDDRMNQLDQARTAIEEQARAIQSVAAGFLAEFERLGADISSLNQHMAVLPEVRQALARLAESMAAIEGRINRIDQNTQKGFFKIRG